jgi:hypothetical protein
MDTLAQTPDSDTEPASLQDRIRDVGEAIAEAETWYAGGLDPESWGPWAA